MPPPAWSLPEPTLTAPAASPDLPAGHAAEPKWDGYRALLGRWADGTVVIRSRRGTDMTAAFPEIAAAAARLPADIGLDGELVVWDHRRLAFERLQGRLNRSAASAARVAAQWPAHFVAFDLLHLGEDLTRWSYVRRRAALEQLFADHALRGPWVLCPSTTDPDTAASWLAWASVGMEGLCFKPLHQPYPGRGKRAWKKYRQRASTEAIIGAVTGTATAPTGVLLGRYDGQGRLRYAGRTTPLPRPAAQALAAQLTPAAGAHPWQGRTFSAGWGSREPLRVELVKPLLVAEVAADVSLAAGRWRHPVRFLRIRPDLSPADAPRFGTGNQPAAG